MFSRFPIAVASALAWILALPHAVADGLGVHLKSNVTEACASGDLVFDPVCGGNCSGITRSFTLNNGRTDVHLPGGMPGRLTVNAPGCWSVPVSIDAAAREVAMTLWPSGTLVGRFEKESATPAPNLEVQIDSANPSIRLKASVVCLVHDGEFRCVLPAIPLDLRLTAEGFIPEYVWRVNVQARKEVRIPPVPLSRGASVVGWVTAETRQKSLAGIEVELAPLSPVSDTPQARSKRLKVKTGAQGFFQVRGVPAGKYTATATTEGLASSPAQVQVSAAGESRLALPLLLRPFSAVDVFITPVTAPDGRPWLVELSRALPMTTAATPVARSAASPAGVWRQAGVAAGRYWIDVKDSSGSRFELRSIDVSATTVPVTIQMEALLIRGRIWMGDQPLEAKLAFQSLEQPTRIVMNSNEKGEFSGSLPGEESGMFSSRQLPPQPRCENSRST
jgi:hypothetical protein